MEDGSKSHVSHPLNAGAQDAPFRGQGHSGREVEAHASV